MCDSPKYVEAIIRTVQELFPETRVIPDTPPENQRQSSVRSFRTRSVAKQQKKITCSNVVASPKATDDAPKNTELVDNNPQVSKLLSFDWTNVHRNYLVSME
ncbi:hypothetical protein L1987_83011 [Smallanthus sonchifolius]|uniref:Uncharacterized protein n=1 Tax=Smallanthus sonchifolius TaxID=185202 RepID=A0ACB8YC37_9ASTR|nr:hypothetical protein L1987_83011 [Smallanthus sonchifolius]